MFLLLGGFAAGLTTGLLIGALVLDLTVGQRLRRRIEEAHSRTTRVRIQQSMHPW